jgi:UDP-GlcNAc:undecaprenyl-phosphate GlcNAc-1-phosphate transferase
MRIIAKKLKIYDIPFTNIKTHTKPIPYLGGVSLIISFFISLFIIRIFTHFPTGTLYSLRGIIIGSIIICILGLIDDIKYKGLGFKIKFLFQIIASIVLLLYGIQIKFIHPHWLGIIFSIVWIVGITNSINIIDIMDGLSSGVVLISSIGFFLIGLPQEEEIYVNFASIALAGACIGFLPYNLSNRYKIFMGDTGSLFLGFVLSSISLGTKYTEVNTAGIFVPIILLAIPIYDTLLVIYFRWSRGRSPFLGSKDHFALRLEKKGYSRKKIILLTYLTGIILTVLAFLITRSNLYIALILYTVIIISGLFIAYKLSKIEIE